MMDIFTFFFWSTIVASGVTMIAILIDTARDVNGRVFDSTKKPNERK